MRFNHQSLDLAWTRDGSSRAVAVLLLHGLSGISSGYDEVVDDLGASADVFRLDLRGHGRSDHAPGTYSVPFYTEDVIAFIEEVISKPVVLVGHSLGGVITHNITATRPDLVLAALCEDLAALKAQGIAVVVVSSGAIALGRGLLGLTGTHLSLEQQQAAASAG